MSVNKESLFAWGRKVFGGHKVLGAVPRVSLVMSGGLLFIVTWAIVAEITARQGFAFSLHWAIEYSEYAIPIIAIWGAAYTLRVEGHVNADVIIHLLTPRVRQWLLLIGHILGLGFLIILSKELFALSLNNIEMGFRSLYPSETHYGYLQLFMAIGLALFTLQLVVEVIRKSRRLFVSYKGKITEDSYQTQIAED